MGWTPPSLHGTGCARVARCLAAAALLPCAGPQGAETARVAAEADPVAAHLERGQAYLEQGEYAKAVLELEQVLTFDNLPPDLRERAEIYARAAQNYQQGKRMSAFGYAETGGGYYRENVTRTTNALGEDPARDWFWKARLGGGLGYILSHDLTVEGTLDYDYRLYDDPERRDDSDLRWSALVNRSLASGSQAMGFRGEVSYRGSDGYRRDYGLFVDQAFSLDPGNRVGIEAEVRSRRYPSGPERELSRDIGEIWLSWTRALMAGRGALTLTLNGGREWVTHDRPAGDQNFYGAQIDWSMDVSERLGIFLSSLWEHNGYHEDVAEDDGIEAVRTLTPDLDTYELGGGLTYVLAPGWSFRPEVLYLRDEGNTRYSDYSSTEIWITVRRSY